MAQRGGSVVAQIRYGENVFSPLTLEGSADAIFSLEMAEAVRCAHFLKPDGFAAVSRHRVIPVTVTTGSAVYPPDIEDRVKRVFPRLKLVDCMAWAAEAGDVRLANTMLVGVLSQVLNITEDSWLRAVEKNVKPAFLSSNITAFKIGRKA